MAHRTSRRCSFPSPPADAGAIRSLREDCMVGNWRGWGRRGGAWPEVKLRRGTAGPPVLAPFPRAAMLRRHVRERI